MVENSLTRESLCCKLIEEEDLFYKRFAINYLAYLGNSKPGKKQIKEMQSILAYVWLRKRVTFDLRLTERERQCLYLSAQGKSIKEIARFFNNSMRRIEAQCQSIFRKLACNNIPEAVAKGLRYGEINLQII